MYARVRTTVSSGPRANDHLWITLSFTCGAVGTHEGSWRTSMPGFQRGAYGTRGGACTDEWGSGLFVAPLGKNRETVTLASPFDLRGHFLDCIEHGATPVADTAWGLKIMAVAEAVLRSAASGNAEKVATDLG